MALVDLLFEKKQPYVQRYKNLEHMLHTLQDKQKNPFFFEMMQTISYMDYLTEKGYGSYAPSFKKNRKIIKKITKNIKRSLTKQNELFTYALDQREKNPLYQLINHRMSLKTRLKGMYHYASLYQTVTEKIPLAKAFYDLSYAYWYLEKDPYLKRKQKHDEKFAQTTRMIKNHLQKSMEILQNHYQALEQKKQLKKQSWIAKSKEKAKQYWYYKLLPRFLPHYQSIAYLPSH